MNPRTRPRLNYGISIDRLFEAGDPVDLKFTDLDGAECCRGVMEWFVHKVTFE